MCPKDTYQSVHKDDAISGDKLNSPLKPKAKTNRPILDGSLEVIHLYKNPGILVYMGVILLK